MKPSFALNLTHDAIALLHRSAQGWTLVGSVPVDEPDLAAALAYLRGSAVGLEPRGITAKLVIPNSEVLYRSITAPGPSAADRRRQIAAALDGATPYAVDELAFDWSGTGDTVQVAVVARETLAEAEAFAVEHRFNPVSFVAAPEPGSFAGEPFFGQSAHAEGLLEPGARVERDQDPIRIVDRDPPRRAADAATAAEPVEATAKEPAEKDPAANKAAADAATSGPAASSGTKASARAETPAGSVPNGAETPAAAAPRRPAPETPRPAVPKSAAPAGATATPAPGLARPPSPVAATPTPPAAPRPAAPVPDQPAPAPGPKPPAKPAGAAPATEPPNPAPPAEPPKPAATAQPPSPAPAAEPLRPVMVTAAGVDARPGNGAAKSGMQMPPPDMRRKLDTPATQPPRTAGPKPASPPSPQEISQSLTPEPLPTAKAAPVAPSPKAPPIAPPASAAVPVTPSPALAEKLAAARASLQKRGAEGEGAPKLAKPQATAARGPAKPAKARRNGKFVAPPAPRTEAAPHEPAGADLPKPQTEAEAMTVFGARREPVGGKPRFLGLMLTGALVVLLALVALWAVLFLDNGTTTGDSGATPAQTAALPAPPPTSPAVGQPEAASPITAPSALPGAAESFATAESPDAPEIRDLAESEVPTPAETEALLPDDAADADLAALDELAPGDIAEAVESALAEVLDPAPVEAAPDSAPEAETVAEAAPVPEIDLAEAPATLAEPPLAETPLAEPPGTAPQTDTASADTAARAAPAGVIHDITIPGRDSGIIAPPAPRLGPPVAGDTPEAPRMAVLAPPFGTVYRFDSEGFIEATPEGILTPDGARLIAGRPPVLPPPRPGGEDEAAAATPAAVSLDSAISAAAAPEDATAPQIAEGTQSAEAAPETPAETPPETPAEAPVPAPADLAEPADDTTEPAPAAEPDPRLAGARPRARPADPAPEPAAEPDGASPAADQGAVEDDADPTQPASSPRPPVRSASIVAAAEAAEVERARVATEAAARAAAEAAAAAAASPMAVALSPRPGSRPANFARTVEAAVAAAARDAQRQQAVARVAPPPAEVDDDDGEPEAPARAAPAIPTRASVAQQATLTRAINLSRVNLIGVYGTANNRHALVRQSNGRYVRVKVGDRLDGGQVVGIGASDLRYSRGGQTVTLTLPRG